MLRAARILALSRKAVGESLAAVARSSVGEWLEDDFVAVLRPIPVP